MRIAAYVLQYGAIIVVASLVAWLIVLTLRRSLASKVWFKAIPVVVVALGLARGYFGPTLEIEPAGPLTLRPGETVSVTVTIRPAVMAALYPFVSFEAPRCWTCLDQAPGFSIEGRMTGASSIFSIKAPPERPAAPLFTRANAAIEPDGRAAAASKFLELRVE